MKLGKSLAEKPWRFGFFEVLRWFESEYDDKPRLGQSKRPADDLLRLGQACSLQFAPSTLSDFQPQQNAPDKLTQNFFGVFGPNGPLPLHLTEYARHRLRHVHDPTMVEFLDVFHHRLISLFYRAWADAQPTVQLDRRDQDRFGFYVNSLLGTAEPGMQRRDAMPDASKRFFVGRLSGATQNAEGLQAILSHYFDIPVEIESFIGEWLEIPQDSYCYLDDDDQVGQLGRSAILGTKSWQCQHKFRIKLGPLSLEEYHQMLPSGGKMKTLVDIVRNYIGLELSWDINLQLKKQEMPVARLGEFGQLGWTTWLPETTPASDVADLLLNAEAFSSQDQHR